MADLGDVDTSPSGAPQQVPTTDNQPDVDPAVTAFVESWVDRIKAAKEAKRTKDAFKRMDRCMQLAKDGGSKEWTESGKNYTVPVLNKLTNQAVAQLYARNPKAVTKRNKRRMFTVWDGTMNTLNQAMQTVQSAQHAMMVHQQLAMQGMAAPPPPPVDPNAMAVIQDAQQVKAYDTLIDGIGDTLTILHNYFIQDPAAQYKQQFKALVRRAEVCGVGYVKLGYQRIMEEDPDIRVKLDEATEKMNTLRQIMQELSDGEVADDSADMEQLRTLMSNLQDELTVIVREGPVFSFPRAKSIIIDPRCVHLKTLAGAGWYAEEYVDLTETDVQRIWKKDIEGQFTPFKADANSWSHWAEKDGKMAKTETARLWRVMNRETGQEFVICEGYKDYVQEPAAPKVRTKRFWDIFPLVFSEIESEEDLYPPSNVWLAHDLQEEYNRSRQGLREHRLANRPAWVTPKGRLSETDLDKFESHAACAILALDIQLSTGEKIQDVVMAKPVMQIDPKQYEVDSIWQDIQRVMGQQQADIGATADSTATESSIAESSRQVGVSDKADDIDDMLSLLVQATGEILLLNMTKESVQQIVGPGAVWPDMPETREEIAESIILDTKAGASGRPNQAADLAKLQTAMPFVLQIPGMSPIPIGERYLELLDVDIEGAVVEGLPSIVAMNQMMAKPPTPAPGGPDGAGAEPGQQGGQGGNNAPRPPGTAPGPQPAYPAPGIHA
jgi:hypothetical protein